jgi:hypothetical protein
MKKFQTAAVLLLGLLVELSMHSATCHANAGSGDLLVDHYVTDALLHRRWAVLVDCAHPDRPWILRDIQWKSESLVSAHEQSHSSKMGRIVPLVRAGTKVQLWRMSDGASIHLSGTAIEAGVTGQTIHVRTGERNTVLEGKVRGPGSIELLPSNKWLKSWSAQ